MQRPKLCTGVVRWMPEYYPSALACYRTRYWSYRILRRPDRARAAFIVDSALKVPYFFRWKTLSRYRRSWYRLYHAALTWRRSTFTLFRNHLSRYLERSARTATSCKESACIWSRGIKSAGELLLGSRFHIDPYILSEDDYSSAEAAEWLFSLIHRVRCKMQDIMIPPQYCVGHEACWEQLAAAGGFPNLQRLSIAPLDDNDLHISDKILSMAPAVDTLSMYLGYANANLSSDYGRLVNDILQRNTTQLRKLT